MDPRTLRTTRLNNEHKELMKLNSSIIRIEPIGIEPYGSYKITFNIKTIISSTPTYQNKTVCLLTIPQGYPKDMPKLAVTDGSKPPWHVNWYLGGTWCAGDWKAQESLANYIYRCAKILQFDLVITNPSSPANKDAIPFWTANKNNRRVIPCDRQILPTIDGEIPKITINPVQKPKITIW